MRELLNRRCVPIAAVLLITLGSLGCGSKADSKTTTNNAPTGGRSKNGGGGAIPVAVATAERKDVPIYLTALGSVNAFNTVSIKTRVDGQLTEVHFKEGQVVNKGDLLAVIDPRSFEIQVSQGEANLAKDQAQLREAKLNLQRFNDLANQGIIPPQQADTQSALVDQLAASIQSDQAQIDNAKLQLNYCHIVAPITGRVGLRLVDEGNMVHAADANPMLLITQLQPITVIFTLPEDNLPSVAHQMEQGQLQVDAYSRDNLSKLGTGQLLTIDNQIDPTTGTGRLKAVFDNKDGALWPNQFVNIQLLLEVRKNATVIPAAAIQRGPQGTFLYVVKPDKTVAVQEVSVAFTQGDISAIDKGLSPGEVVVTDGQDRLQANTKVEFRKAGKPNEPASDDPDAT